MVFIILLLSVWQFWALERSLNQQIALGNSVLAQQDRLLQLVAHRDPQLLRPYGRLRTGERESRRLVTLQRARTLYLVRMGLIASLALLGAIGVWIAAFAFTMRRARVHRTAALKDSLTGISNRSGAVDALRKLTRNSHGESFGVVFLDLDGFKKINDVHGHARGDLLLQTVAKRLSREVRKEDRVARLGGDEFVCLIAPPTSREHLRVIAGRLQHAVTRPYSMDQDHFVIGCSAGYSLFPDDGADAELLLHRADDAMYTAKAAGGGVRAATPLQTSYRGA